MKKSKPKMYVTGTLNYATHSQMKDIEGPIKVTYAGTYAGDALFHVVKLSETPQYPNQEPYQECM